MQNTLYTNDNLYILNGLNSDSVDLIYLDPPFNSKRTYSAPVGTKAAGASFKDIWTWEDVDVFCLEKLSVDYPDMVDFIKSIGKIHSKAMMSYILYMAQRLIELHRILKETGSLYLHCDPTASHYLKQLLDAIFGSNNFRNEIVWCYRGMPAKAKKFQSKHDIILFYRKSEKAIFNQLFDEPTEGSLRTFASGRSKGYNVNLSKKMVTVFDWEKYDEAVKNKKLPSDLNPVEFSGGMPPMKDWWEIKILGGPGNKERTGYPTQKPLAILDRIIKASCPEGGVVLDPFCGCATTCVAAQRLGRKWIGIDIEEKAIDILLERLDDGAEGKSARGIFVEKPVHTTLIPVRTDVEELLITKETKNDIKKRLFAIQEKLCNGCMGSFDIVNLEIDHIVPKSKGGGDYIENYQLLCGHCNRTKGARPMEYLRMKIEAREKLRAKVSFGE
jgi:DNA modification methylase